jgi:CHAT domain-containing protein
MNKFQNQKCIRNAKRIIFNPAQEIDLKMIEYATQELKVAQYWAKEHHFTADENDALWCLYECYSRTKQDNEAIAALQALWTNLEATRHQIKDPLSRAGVIHGERGFPRLFRELCRLCYRTRRISDLLTAIEGSKGRALAEVLAAQEFGGVVSADLILSVQTLSTLMLKVNAHYLSYFVDDEETYAVLVAKDGTFHIPDDPIPLGKTQLQKWLRYDHNIHNPLNPQNWGKFISRKQGKVFRVLSDLTNRLAPLVSWLEALVKKSILQQDDHLCYCPDAQLHLIPLHYIPFLDEPLVKFFSVSRIHGASALTAILNRKPLRPHQYTAVRISALTDRDSELNNVEQKLAAFRRVPEWLQQSPLTGQIVSEEDADLPTVAILPFKQRLVHFATHGIFPDKDNENRDINPYVNSGLLLAQNGQLPCNKEGTNTSLLTPHKVLYYKLNFWGSHVTLSACVSGLAKEGIGGDALGLEWTLLQAGASSLLATHWDVDVEWVAEFSEMFYQKWLFKGVSRAAAWRESVLNLMEKNPPSEHEAAKYLEYFWAAFSLSGDWR